MTTSFSIVFEQPMLDVAVRFSLYFPFLEKTCVGF